MNFISPRFPYCPYAARYWHLNQSPDLDSNRRLLAVDAPPQLLLSLGTRKQHQHQLLAQATSTAKVATSAITLCHLSKTTANLFVGTLKIVYPLKEQVSKNPECSSWRVRWLCLWRVHSLYAASTRRAASLVFLDGNSGPFCGIDAYAA